jgi:AmmeMemoRadiSam system protein B
MKKKEGKVKIRKPSVAGRFYPGTKSELTEQINSLYLAEKDKINISYSKENIIGGVIPHAGYMFSGYEAIHFFEVIKHTEKRFDTIIILNPNHSGMGEPVALDTNHFWETPLGNVEIDIEFSQKLDIAESEPAHTYEHSGEVMLPFLLYFLDKPFKIVPISITNQNYEVSKQLANDIYKANQDLKKDILLIASSDFSHYVSPEEGARKDELVLNEILNFNTEEVHVVILKNNISVCGYGPIMTVMEYSKLVSGSPKAEILRKGHSGEVLHSNEVVDYVTILFYS